MSVRARKYLTAICVTTAIGAFATTSAAADDPDEAKCTSPGKDQCQIFYPCVKWEGNFCAQLSTKEEYVLGTRPKEE